MTNREKFLEYLQEEVDILKMLPADFLASCANIKCNELLRSYAATKGEFWEDVRFCARIPEGQHERIVAWLQKEAVKNE